MSEPKVDDVVECAECGQLGVYRGAPDELCAMTIDAQPWCDHEPYLARDRKRIGRIVRDANDVKPGDRVRLVKEYAGMPACETTLKCISPAGWVTTRDNRRYLSRFAFREGLVILLDQPEAAFVPRVATWEDVREGAEIAWANIMSGEISERLRGKITRVDGSNYYFGNGFADTSRSISQYQLIRPAPEAKPADPVPVGSRWRQGRKGIMWPEFDIVAAAGPNRQQRFDDGTTQWCAVELIQEICTRIDADPVPTSEVEERVADPCWTDGCTKPSVAGDDWGHFMCQEHLDQSAAEHDRIMAEGRRLKDTQVAAQMQERDKEYRRHKDAIIRELYRQDGGVMASSAARLDGLVRKGR